VLTRWLFLQNCAEVLPAGKHQVLSSPQAADAWFAALQNGRYKLVEIAISRCVMNACRAANQSRSCRDCITDSNRAFSAASMFAGHTPETALAGGQNL
jgi:hypothetical protein